MRGPGTGILALLLAALAGCGGGEPAPHFPGVFVMGFDGMEPSIVEKLMAKGELPNFSRLKARGTFSRLGTSNPPESPVAWANFITGMDPGGHGIFDFVQHELLPNRIGLYLSTSKSTEPSNFLPVPGGYRIPLSPGETKLLVHGKYFWEYLTARGIPVSIVRVPSNYPPKKTGAREFPGMGTPDLEGTYGMFSYYTDDPPPGAPTRMGSAHVFRVVVAGGAAVSELRGPVNSYVAPPAEAGPGWAPPWATVPLVIYPDEERGAARIDVGDETRVLTVGEWSDWVPVRFTLVPHLATAHGMVRLYLKELSPHLRLYVSPVNADPENPDISLSDPPEACEELAARIGRYYTQGMAEETQADRYGIFDTGEFLRQARIVLEERKKMLDVEIERFRRLGGLTFFYFSTTDLCAHMLFKYMDPEHPLYDPEGARKYGGEVARIYREMDALLGKVMRSVPRDTLVIAMSDHGFRSYRRQLSVSTWLFENGYLSLVDPSRQGEFTGYANVDWDRTQAYSVGFVGVSVNQYGREFRGTVNPGAESETLKRRIIRGLEGLRDPKNGQRVLTKVYRREEIYHGPQMEKAPDLILGFAVGYGCTDDSVKGAVPRLLLKDTDDAWSGSHMMDPRHVPGILFANRKFRLEHPKLYDLPVSILAEFGITPTGMRGKRIW